MLTHISISAGVNCFRWMLDFMCLTYLRRNPAPWFWTRSFLGTQRIHLFEQVFQSCETEISAVGVTVLESLLSTVNLWGLDRANSERLLIIVENVPEGQGLSVPSVILKPPSAKNLCAWNLFLAIMERSMLNESNTTHLNPMHTTLDMTKIVISDDDLAFLVGCRTSISHFCALWSPALGNHRFRFLWRYPSLLETVIISDLFQTTDWKQIDGLDEFVKCMTITKPKGVHIEHALECAVSLDAELSEVISWECLHQLCAQCDPFSREAVDDYTLRNGKDIVNQASTILMNVLNSNRNDIAFECSVNLLFILSSSIDLPPIENDVYTRIGEFHNRDQYYNGNSLRTVFKRQNMLLN